jgi:uncharacterized protein (DUF4213/DUF364 family)
LSTNTDALCILEECRIRLRNVLADCGVKDMPVTVTAKVLSSEEAIGSPERRDYPILEGKERVIEASVLGARGQAFTDSPCDFAGQLTQVLELPLTTNSNRAIFIAAMNAILHQLSGVNGVLHCKDDGPVHCASEIARQARNRGVKSVGLIGLNPSIAEALVTEFGSGAVHITDLNPQNIGICRSGVTVWNGHTQTQQLVCASDLVIVTGTTLVNGTFDGILDLACKENKLLIVFGITAAAVCHLLKLERWCTQARDA